MYTKRCSKCKETKEIHLFTKNRTRYDGLGSHCKMCHAAKHREPSDKEKNKIVVREPKNRFKRSQNSAKDRKVSWELTYYQWIMLILGKGCHYCDGRLPETGSSLDRKDSSIGYIRENVVPCCWECNKVKCDLLTYEEMVEVGKLLKRLRNFGSVVQSSLWDSKSNL